MKKSYYYILLTSIVALFFILGGVFTHSTLAQSLNRLLFQADSGYEINTNNATQNLDISTKATDGGSISIGA